MKKLFLLFLIVYAVFLAVSINPSYLDADQSSHAMTGVFFNRFFNDWSANPTIDPGSVYDYVMAYYARYPKFVFQYGPVYPLINSLFYNQLFMKLVTAGFSVMTLWLVYLILSDLFNKEVAVLASLITAFSSVFLDYSRMVMPNIASVFFLTLGLFFYFKRRGKAVHYVLSGVFFGLSILTKEFALVFVGIICLLTLKDFVESVKLNSYFFIALFLTLLPYIALLFFTGGVNVLLDYPQKQAWYGERNQDPQWYELSGWLYFWQLIVQHYTIIGLPLLVIGLYYSYKNKKRLSFLFVILAYLAVTFISDKASQRILYGMVFISGLIAYAVQIIYQRLTVNWHKGLVVFLVTLMMITSLPLLEREPSIPMSVVAQDLKINCPNCTVLVASEAGVAYSSYLMYESLIRDPEAGMRFIRPTVFESRSALEVISDELVNRVVVIGSLEFIRSNPETSGYAEQVEFIMNHYDLLSVYNASIIDRIYVYDTGVTGVKEAPFCATSISMSRSFCTDYDNPVMALRSF